LASMATNYDKYKAAGAEILAISVDPIDKNRELAEKLKLPFPVLSDADHKVIDTYDILDMGGKIARAAVFVLDKKGIVRWAYVADDYKVRPLDETVLAELNKIK
jgi:thioredoxin-dependent peroxiredoxin